MKISKHLRREAKGLFQSCRVNGLLDEQRARLAVQTVLAQKPRGYVGILSHFQRLLRFDLQRRTARVESAVALTAAQQAQVSSNLARRYGPGLNLNFSQNPALLGGMRIKVGSDVYDGTVQARLDALAESF
ncbi:MAG TPA: F0F1 ATP synthase subunit delta [Verrucomicrobiae bacterium]|nr:F0F1 ATP synthase subunit delta [Verrucomicrobiae bacterium]